MEVNYNLTLKKKLEYINRNNIKPNLFLHVCCGPCATNVLKKLYDYFNIYVVFYNPNIDTSEEYNLRFKQLLKIIQIEQYSIKIVKTTYNHLDFLQNIKGLEEEIEGGKRCEKCIYNRLLMSYYIINCFIKENNLINTFNYFTTTLTISPHKNAKYINEIGEEICKKNNNNIKYLLSDFKKENGFLNSSILSKQYNLYRQNYCGCEFSKNFHMSDK